MPKLPRISAADLVGALKRMGFVEHRQRGSHLAMKHSDGRRTIVPMHSGDIPIGTLRGILKDIDVPPQQLGEML